MIVKKFTHFILLAIWCSFLFYQGCSSSNDPGPVDCAASDLALTFTKTDLSACNSNDGSINASATGGVAPYQYALDAQAYGSSSNFTGLGAGVYQLKVKDGNGCERTQSVTVNSFGTTLAANVAVSNSGCTTADGVITITASGGTEPYTYQIGTSASTSSSSFNNLAAGNYTVKITDNTGCSVTQSVKVTTGVKFSTQVKSIIDTKCAISGCHVSGTANSNFTVFANVQANAVEIKQRTQNGTMPKGGDKLPQAELDLIACWVDDGAQNN